MSNHIINKIEQLIRSRGYHPDDFYSWDLKKLPDFNQLNDMDKSVQRILKAIENKERIVIYGDYDVDGTTSCALLYHFFKTLNHPVLTLQPSRFVDGYGLHQSSIDWAVDNHAQLMITVDCGVTSFESAEYAKNKLDLIITDHHQAHEKGLPPAYAIINPNRLDEPESSCMRKLAGVGVAFALAICVRQKLIDLGGNVPSLYPLLPFVALGTICDLAWLNPMNLKLVRHGLKQFPQTPFAGLNVFLTADEKKLNILPSEKLSFHIGPIINSKGRLDHPELALKLLTCENDDESKHIYQKLQLTNQERKNLQATVFKEAKEQILKNMKSPSPLLHVVYSAKWHEGVIGIVASKLVENFKVPAIVLTDSEEKGIIKASARTAGELNLYQLLASCEELFIKFGGHKAAAGFSMKKEKLNLLQEKLEAELEKIPEILRKQHHSFDLEVNFEELNAELLIELQKLEPFGVGNPKPILRISNAKVQNYQVLKGNHVKWTLTQGRPGQATNRNLGGISFNYFDRWNTLSPEEILRKQEEQQVQIDCHLGKNFFNGRSFLQAYISSITF